MKKKENEEEEELLIKPLSEDQNPAAEKASRDVLSQEVWLEKDLADFLGIDSTHLRLMREQGLPYCTLSGPRKRVYLATSVYRWLLSREK